MTGALAGSAERVSELLRDFFVTERTAAADGFLQRREPRVKLACVFGVVVAAMLARSPGVLLALGCVVPALALASRVPLRRLLARSAVIPLFSLVVVAPQLVLTPGDPLVGLGPIAGLGPLVGLGPLAVTDAGVAYVATFTLRVAVAVSLLSLLVLTTPFSAVVAAMRGLGVPTTLTWVFAVTYRYLFLFFDELRRLLLARNSRTTGGDVRAEWADARRLSGTFLLRTLERGERVGRGMRARGGARAPSPYARARPVNRGDGLLVALALAALALSVVIRWGL